MFRNLITEDADIVGLIIDDFGPGALLVTLKVYLDKGYKTDSALESIVSVAATVFHPSDYLHFTHPWNEMLSRWGAPAFHATDFYAGYQHFTRDTPERKEWFDADCRAIPKIIGSHIAHGLVVSFIPSEVRRDAPPEWLSNVTESDHTIAVRLLLVLMGYWAKDVGHAGGLLYFMERGDDDEAEVIAAAREMETSPVSGQHVQVADFLAIKKGSSRGLEAADFLAWHWNKHWADRMRSGLPLRKDFQAFVDYGGVDRVATAHITGDKLKMLFSLHRASLTYSDFDEAAAAGAIFLPPPRDEDQS